MRLSDPYFELTRRASGVLVLTRTVRTFEGVAELRESCRWLLAALEDVARSRSVLVVDVRLSRGRNDFDFEKEFASTRAALYAGWAHAAAICLTEVGRMHLRRHMKNDGYAWPVACDADKVFADADRIASAL